MKRLREREAATQRELPKLRGDAAQTRRAEAEAAGLRNELQRSATNGIAGPMAEMMSGSLEQSSQRRLSRMEELLNLS